MPVIHFQEADSPERPRIDEGLVAFARRADRLETGRADGKCFLNHEEGCNVGGERIGGSDEFFFDTETARVRVPITDERDGRNGRSDPRATSRQVDFARARHGFHGNYRERRVRLDRRR